MKLRLPNDVEGGLVLFSLAIGITIVELFFVKKVANSSKRGKGFTITEDAQSCLDAGGSWAKSRFGIPGCCRNVSSSPTREIRICEIECHPDCAFHYTYPQCGGCPRPKGWGGSEGGPKLSGTNSGGFL